MNLNLKKPEIVHCDSFRVIDYNLICLFEKKEVKVINLNDIIGWSDTAQGSYSILLKNKPSLDFPGYPEGLAKIMRVWFPDSFHSW